MAKYGGLWIDASTICFQPFDDWMYSTIASERTAEGIGAAWRMEAKEQQ